MKLNDGSTWDFAGTEVCQESTDMSVPISRTTFPTRWRVFGPHGPETTQQTGWSFHRGFSVKPLVNARTEDLKRILSTLTVGQTILTGRDADLNDGFLDLGALFGGYKTGQQAYLMAELDVEADEELIFGAGCDYWMQWWIDGELAFDNLPTGNGDRPFNRTNVCFRKRLVRGRHLLCVRVISGSQGWLLYAGFATPEEEKASRNRHSLRWRITPDSRGFHYPQPHWRPHLAVRTDRSFADVTVECEYQQNYHGGNFGLVLAAQDPEHYYYAYVPTWGQLWRARGFWAAIGLADGSGYIRNLKMQLVPNVPGQADLWRSLKVRRRGTQIQMWVNGVKGPCVDDTTYDAGRVGILGFGPFDVRNFQIEGRAEAQTPWKSSLPADPRRTVENDLNLGDFQNPYPIVKLGDEILLAMTLGRDGRSCHQLNDLNAAVYFYRSNNGGRTWTRKNGPKPLSTMPVGLWTTIGTGTIRVFNFDEARQTFIYQDSVDRGLTWNEKQPGHLHGDWTRELLREGAWNGLFNLIRLRDGRLMAVLLHGYRTLEAATKAAMPNAGQGTWGTNIAQPYASFSEDQGQTWSTPVAMDYAADTLDKPPDSPCGGFSETAVAQLSNGKIVAVARPFRSPFMWQTESSDGGKTWRQACYAPFSGAGGPCLVATRSDYLVLFKRGPGIGLNISIDGGLNWDEGTMIDHSCIFNGSAMEVEPDVVLVAYPETMDEIRPGYVRTHRIRITTEGPKPEGD